MSTLTAFLAWSTVINIGVLIIATLAVMLMRDSMGKIHGKMFGLDDTNLSRAYFQYIAQYKIAIFIFNLVPYLALRIIA